MNSTKLLKTTGLVIAPLVFVSAVIAGVVETRIKLTYTQEDVKLLEGKLGPQEAKVKVLERRADDIHEEVEKQDEKLDDIKDSLEDLHIEQRVQGQLLKSFIEEYRRKEMP